MAKTETLVGTFWKLKETGSTYRVYAVTGEKKGLPADTSVAYLVLHKPTRRLFGTEQKLATVPVEFLQEFYTFDPQQ